MSRSGKVASNNFLRVNLGLFRVAHHLRPRKINSCKRVSQGTLVKGNRARTNMLNGIERQCICHPRTSCYVLKRVFDREITQHSIYNSELLGTGSIHALVCLNNDILQRS